MSNDSISKTLFVAISVCIFFSLLVSLTAVSLKALQEENKVKEKRKNVLIVADLYEEGKSIKEAFEKITSKIVDLETGDYIDQPNPLCYDAKNAVKDPVTGIDIPKDKDKAKILRRAKCAQVFLVKENQEIKTIILPVYGKGLWSTMYGFLALKEDVKTVQGFTFYEHGETPGLGGEVDNPLWKKQFPGKKVFDENWNLKFKVLKGKVDRNRPEAIYQVDGLSGSTLTTNGIKDLFTYWLGEHGFGPYLAKIRARGGENGQS